MSRFFPWVVVGAAVVFLMFAATPQGQQEHQMYIEGFGAIPVREGGRVKPLDTFARVTLMGFSNRQTYRDLKGNERSATQWLLEVMTSEMNLKDQTTRKEDVNDYRIFRIENDQVLGLVGVGAREGFRYSYNELAPRIDDVMRQAAVARGRERSLRSAFDNKVLELDNHLATYLALREWRTPQMVPPLTPDGDWEPFLKAIAQMRHAHESGLQVEPNRGVVGLANIFRAYAENRPDDFNKAVRDYHAELEKELPRDSRTTGFEAFFNHFEPFYQCSLLYVLAFVLGCLAWVGWQGPLNRAAFWLLAVTLVVHTWGILARMYIQGRPPVTNLYSSAVFIGWACVGLCLVLEVIFRNGIGTVVAAVTGAATVLVAHILAENTGDTMEMLQAVLDTNFWLATHVTCITLGYSTTFVAGFLGIVFIVRGLLTRSLDREMMKGLSQMIYGVVCFATLLSFTGTILGGIWADQSWGRFWGWDAKENGAMLIVIWNALVLHARWGGMVKQRGMAVLVVVGNLVTAWSWFGTNQLQVGLHSYGFSSTLAKGLVAFWASQAVVIVMGLVPLRYWQSFNNAESRPAPARQPGRPRLQPGV